MSKNQYTEDSIKSLDWREHIRLRPGMYIGKLGNGKAPDDGIYVLVKEVVDNCIDEYVMGHGKQIDIEVNDKHVKVRDFGRGIPLGKVIDCVSKINTGAKYDSEAFKKSVGLNGVGTKAVNALSEKFYIASYRESKVKEAEFEQGIIRHNPEPKKSSEHSGTLVKFTPDESIFKNYQFRPELLNELIWNYAYLNKGLTLKLNDQTFHAKNGLLDLLTHKTEGVASRYPVIYLEGKDIEIAITHGDQYGEEYYSFVNGQYTTMGGTHLAAFREGFARTVKEFYKKDLDAADIRMGIIAAVSVRIQEPVFESQTKTKLGSQTIAPDGPPLRNWVMEFLNNELLPKLHRQKDVAEALLQKILDSEKERKDIAGIRKLAGARAKRANLFNKKLRDCRSHLNDDDYEKEKTTIFITEGDSASGSLTKARDSKLQAVFSLRGKPLNCFGLSKKIVYENEEFNLLQHALNIEESLDGLRYNRVVIATDADVDGMHIRLLILTFFLQFFPELVRRGHLYILQTPLFRVRDKSETFYCYNETEKQKAITKLGKRNAKVEITRFKGLGEISPDEFEGFIGEDIRLDPVLLSQDTSIQKLLDYYMGKNTPDRQNFIISNLRIETNDVAEELSMPSADIGAATVLT